MAIKFQYNKTSLGELDKQLKMRTKALPTIKSKESALRVERNVHEEVQIVDLVALVHPRRRKQFGQKRLTASMHVARMEPVTDHIAFAGTGAGCD